MSKEIISTIILIFWILNSQTLSEIYPNGNVLVIFFYVG